jgi:hypothetical protein
VSFPGCRWRSVGRKWVFLAVGLPLVVGVVVLAGLRPWHADTTRHASRSSNSQMTVTCWSVEGSNDHACVYTRSLVNSVENHINGAIYHSVTPTNRPTVGADITTMTRGTCKGDARMAR